MLTLLLAMFFAADAPKPAPIPDGMKQQLYKAKLNLIDADTAVQKLIEADPKLKQAFDALKANQQSFAHTVDVVNKFCGAQFIWPPQGDPECVAKKP